MGRGIIPARAGFTPHEGALRVLLRDHPRSRGVYTRTCFSSPELTGSSPLARGLHYATCPHRKCIGIIPARAGFTSTTSSVWSTRRDHPRSRGVYSPRRVAFASSRGSSPLARGLRICSRSSASILRIIPARAGFTCSPPPAGPAATDHPRSRGVYGCARTPA